MAGSQASPFTAGFTDVQGLTAAAALAVPVVVGNVPEPASVLMLVAGLAALGWVRRRACRQ